MRFCTREQTQNGVPNFLKARRSLGGRAAHFKLCFDQNWGHKNLGTWAPFQLGLCTALLQVTRGKKAVFFHRAVVCARMHGLGCLGVEILSKHDGNTFPHSHLSFNLNIFERYFCSKLPSKKVLGVKRLVLILITKATYEARNLSTRAWCLRMDLY